jgi:glutathione S-transferase
MALVLYFHPLASFCHKVLVALYENGTPFEPHVVDLGDERSRAAFFEIAPMGKFPVIRDGGAPIIESSTIIEYLTLRHPGPTALVPKDPALALEVRARDRFFDSYVHEPMQKIVVDTLRPSGQNDPFGVAEARRTIETAFDVLERELGEPWAIGDAFSMADCAAAPALFYANVVAPFGDRPRLAAYLRRLMERPSFARVLEEARPHFASFPMRAEMRERYGF